MYYKSCPKFKEMCEDKFQECTEQAGISKPQEINYTVDAVEYVE